MLFEDDAVLAVCKPAGVVAIPARGEPPERSLRVALEAARNERLFVVHRLDRETSGVLLFARTAAAHRTLSAAFEHREVRKRYVCLTRGAPPAASGTIALPLHTARKGKMRPALPGEPGALASATEYTCAATYATRGAGTIARVECRPLTGRQHQIRVHLRAVNAPLVVDALYGRGATALAADALGAGSPPLARLALHALSLEAPHPVAGRPPLRVVAPIADDLAGLIAWLDASVASPGARS